MRETEIAYLCETQEQLEFVLSYYNKLGYTHWGSNKSPLSSKRIEIPRVLYADTSEKTVQTSSVRYAIDTCIKFTRIPMFPIKEEYLAQFKKMFRLNRIPNELTPEQIERMSNEKVLELWT